MRKLYSPDKTEIVGILVTTIGTYTVENVRDEGGVVEYDDPQSYTPVTIPYGEPTDEYFNAQNQRVFVDEAGDYYNEDELVYEDGTPVGEEPEEEEEYV